MTRNSQKCTGDTRYEVQRRRRDRLVHEGKYCLGDGDGDHAYVQQYETREFDSIGPQRVIRGYRMAIPKNWSTV